MAKLWYDVHATQWCTKITRQGQSRKFYLGHNKKEAAKGFHQLMADLNSGKLKLFPDRGIPLPDLAESYLEFVQTNRAPATFSQYQVLLSAFVSDHRGKAAEDIGAMGLEQYKQKLLNKGKAPETVVKAILSCKTELV